MCISVIEKLNFKQPNWSLNFNQKITSLLFNWLGWLIKNKVAHYFRTMERAKFSFRWANLPTKYLSLLWTYFINLTMTNKQLNVCYPLVQCLFCLRKFSYSRNVQRHVLHFVTSYSLRDNFIIKAKTLFVRAKSSHSTILINSSILNSSLIKIMYNKIYFCVLF